MNGTPIITGEYKKYWKVALVLLVAVYVCNFFTPLRLSEESIWVLHELDLKLGARTKPYHIEYHPASSGYTWLLYALSKLGVLNSFVIVLLQLAFLLGSFFYLRKLLVKQSFPPMVAVLFLLNCCTINFAVMPRAEMQYLFLASAALYYYQSFDSTRRPWQLVLGLMFGGLAFYTLKAGVFLILAIVISLLFNKVNMLVQSLNWRRPTSSVIAILTFVFLIILGLMGDGQQIFWNLMWQAEQIGELTLNLPFNLLPGRLASVFISVFIVAAVSVMILFIWALFSRKLDIPRVIRIYLFIHLPGIFFLQDFFFSTGTWLTILPLMMWVLWMRLKPELISGSQKILCRAFLTLYVAGGIFYLCYNTWLSFDRRALSEQQDNGKWRIEYKAHFFDAPFESADHSKDAIYFLNKYDGVHIGVSLPDK